MTRLLPVFAVFICASPVSAEVLNPRQEVTIAGTANPACVIRGPALASGSNISFAPSGANAGEIRFTQLVNASTAEVREAQVDLVLPIVCNSAHRFVLKSANRGLSRVGEVPASGAFRTSVPYSVSATWQGRQIDQSSEAGEFVIDIPGSGAGDLSLSIAVPPGGQPLVAGSYSDTITVQLEVAS